LKLALKGYIFCTHFFATFFLLPKFAITFFSSLYQTMQNGGVYLAQVAFAQANGQHDAWYGKHG